MGAHARGSSTEIFSRPSTVVLVAQQVERVMSQQHVLFTFKQDSECELLELQLEHLNHWQLEFEVLSLGHHHACQHCIKWLSHSKS
jgi:hypothetical protein